MADDAKDCDLVTDTASGQVRRPGLDRGWFQPLSQLGLAGRTVPSQSEEGVQFLTGEVRELGSSVESRLAHLVG